MKLFVNVVFLPMIPYIGAGMSKILVGTILSGSSPHTVVMLSQNKKGGNYFKLHRFFEYFFSVARCK